MVMAGGWIKFLITAQQWERSYPDRCTEGYNGMIYMYIPCTHIHTLTTVNICNFILFWLTYVAGKLFQIFTFLGERATHTDTMVKT
jgi:hypothetical protein